MSSAVLSKTQRLAGLFVMYDMHRDSPKSNPFANGMCPTLLATLNHPETRLPPNSIRRHGQWRDHEAASQVETPQSRPVGGKGLFSNEKYSCTSSHLSPTNNNRFREKLVELSRNDCY